MMNGKEVGKRLKNRGTVLALTLGLIPLVAASFGFVLPFNYEEIIYAISGILVMLGILHDPKQDTFFLDEDGNGIPDHIDDLLDGGIGEGHSDESDEPEEEPKG